MAIKPDPAVSGSPVQIVASFREKTLGQSNSLTKAESNENSASESDIFLTATASVRDATGSEVGILNMIKSSENEYTGTWKTALAGVYNVTLKASSLAASETFPDALQFEVMDNESSTNSSVSP